MTRCARLVSSVLLTSALAGCVVGPNYKGAPAVVPDAVSRPTFLRAEPSMLSTSPSTQWWTTLSDAELDRLETAALASASSLEIAEARLRQSRAGLRRSRADRLPNTQATALYLRTHSAASFVDDSVGGAPGSGSLAQPGLQAASETLSSETFQFYDIGFDATWELDLFGGRARAVEGARAAAEAAAANVYDAEVSLTAEVARTYVQLRSLQQLQALSRHTAIVQAQLLALTSARRTGGTATELDVERLQDQLQVTRNAIVPLQVQVTEALDRLATLISRPPGALDAALATASPVPLPPPVVAVGDPSTLLRRRPDIRGAERRIQQKTALIGERTADLFPKVSLLGDVGFGSTNISGLLVSGGFSNAIAPMLQWSPFAFGRTQARISQAKASRDEALADYRRTVLNALEDAESALSRYGDQRAALSGLLRAQDFAEHESALTDLRVRGGTATSLDILQAEGRRIQAETSVAQARAELTQDYISLQKSLGLGWSTSDPVDRSSL